MPSCVSTPLPAKDSARKTLSWNGGVFGDHISPIFRRKRPIGTSMPFPLPLRPLPAPRETVLSFLSRFAAMNAAKMSDFSIDVGHQIRRFLDLETAALDCLAEAAGLEPAIRDELASWTGVPAGDVRMAFRGEAFVSRALRNPVIRGCPLCLQEDAQATPGHPERLMAMRGDWLLRSVNLCCRHHHPLVPLWEVANPGNRAIDRSWF
ncbi:TniQ family protein [Sulfitobacter sp. LCG007]